MDLNAFVSEPQRPRPRPGPANRNVDDILENLEVMALERLLESLGEEEK